MAKYIFPFDKVAKGSDIVIYAMGVVGQCYLEQVKMLEYCNVVASVDKNASEIYSEKYQVEPLDILRRCVFDYIIIAVLGERTAEAIREELEQDYGISPEKIIWTETRQLNGHISLYRLSQMVKGYQELSSCLENFMQWGNGNINSFANAIEELRINSYTNAQLCEKHKVYFMDYLAQEPSAKKRIILLRFLFEAECFDMKCAELFMHSIRELRGNYESRIWLMWDLSCMEARNASIRYDNFFLDKRAIIRENITPFLDVSKCVRGTHENGKKRIAIVGSNFDWTPSSHFKFMRPYANEMCAQGYKVKIFPIDLLRYREGECFIQPLLTMDKRSYLSVDEYPKLLAPGIEVVIPIGATIQERIDHFVKNLYDYNPDIVYDFSGEYAYCSPIYYDAFPTVAMPMRGYASSAWFDKYVARDRQICIEENRVFHSISEEQLEEALPDPGKYNIQADESFSRSEQGFDENTFLIVTSGYRLRQELTKEFVDCVCSFLKEHADARWLLVGDGICDYVKLIYKSFLEEGRIIEWGFEPNLYGLYGICDIFWNPDRNGAAGCIYMAMQCGLPIVTTAIPSDILPYLGRENAIEGSYNECVKYVERLYSDEELRREKGRLMSEITRYIPNGTENYVKKLIEVGESIPKK